MLFLAKWKVNIIFFPISENLEPHEDPLEIGHPEVGRYFSEFSNTHYVANEELETRYPEDMSETLCTVRRLYHRLLPSSGGNQSKAQETAEPAEQQAMPM